MHDDIIGKFKKIIKKQCPYCKHDKYELREIEIDDELYKNKKKIESIYHCKKCGEIWSAEYKVCKMKSAKWVGK